jgi:hypothetical protein
MFFLISIVLINTCQLKNKFRFYVNVAKYCGHRPPLFSNLIFLNLLAYSSFSLNVRLPNLIYMIQHPYETQKICVNKGERIGD